MHRNGGVSWEEAMSGFRTALALTCILALPLPLCGCPVMVIGGLAAAGGAGYAAAQERGVNGSADDFVIKTQIDQALLQADRNMQAGITTTVYNGRVLLTGRLPNDQMKMTAGQVARGVQNVRTVFNEIEVAPQGTSAWDDTRDAFITTQVRSEMVLNSDIRSINYSIDTANGSVYLMGSARSQRELDQATKIARYVPGVRRVVSFVELRYGSPVASDPSAPVATPYGSPPPGAYQAPPPGMYGGGQPAPISRAPIEVQKL
jgi:osmotically-inducible protein OsmY